MTVIFVIATIIFFLGIDWVVQRLKRGRAVEAAAVPQPVSNPYSLRTPEGIFFAKSHTWLSLFPSGRIRLGVDDFVAGLMETPGITLLKAAGAQVEKGDPLLLLEEGDHRLTIRSPLSGEIQAVNADLEKTPARMRDKLFSDGWAYTIRPRRLEDLRNMLLGSESRAWMADEFRRLRDLLTGTAPGVLAPASMQDGGAPVAGVFKQLDPAKWQQLEEQFLQVQ